MVKFNKKINLRTKKCFKKWKKLNDEGIGLKKVKKKKGLSITKKIIVQNNENNKYDIEDNNKEIILMLTQPKRRCFHIHNTKNPIIFLHF